ncbi:MAG: glycosyltransferase family 39 protein [bacterium]|nr:glycosyltransferase family 39 protein [bacterium]
MILPVVIILLISLFLSGSFLLSKITPQKENFFFLLGVGFGVFVIIIMSWMLIFSWIGIPIERSNATLLFVSIVIASLFLRTKKWPFPSVPPIGKFEYFLLLLITSLVAFVSLESVLRLPMGWDGLATWLLQAKAIYLAHGLDREIFFYAQFDSPPGIGLLVAYFYTLLGGVEDNAVLLLFSAFYVACIFVLYGSIREFTNRRVALIFVFLFASLQSVIRQAGRFDAGYVDLPLAYFFLCAGVLLLRYKFTSKPIFLLLSFLFAGMGSLIKNEGVVFFLFFLLISIRQMLPLRLKKILHILPGLLIFLAWLIYKTIGPFYPSYLSHGHLVLERVFLVSHYMFIEFFRIDRWNLIWIFLLICSVAIWRRLLSLLTFQLALFQLLAYFVIYLLTPLDALEHIHGSFDRLLLHITPLVIFSVAFCAYDILNKKSIFKIKHAKRSTA